MHFKIRLKGFFVCYNNNIKTTHIFATNNKIYLNNFFLEFSGNNIFINM